MIMAGKIQFPDNPVLRWNFDNVSIIQDPAENIKPVKRNSSAHIDLIIALLCALHGHLAAAPTVQADYYATHDLFISGG
jgi:phage terminase large subunit-like protein